MSEKEFITNPEISVNHPTKLLTVFAMLRVTFLILAIFTAVKTFSIGPIVFSVAVIAYPFTYIFADIFTEVYGYRVTRKIVWTWFACILIASWIWYLYSIISPSESFTLQNEFAAIFKLAPIVAIATILWFFLGELSNSWVLAKMKILTQWKKQRLRLVWSTLVGQFVDNTVAFTLIFTVAGVFATDEIVPLIISSVTFCTLREVLVLPLTYKVIAWVKQVEGLDTYDYTTSFNPFKFK